MMNALQTLREQLVAQEVPAETIASRIDEAQMQLSTAVTEQTHALTAQWEQDNPGQQPTFVQLQELHARARMIAEEVFLSQVSEQLEDEPTTSPSEIPVDGPRVQTWWVDETLAPDEQMQELADQLWPDRSERFRVWAADLLEARRLDALPLPSSPQEDLASEVAAEVDRVLMTISSQSST